MTLLICMYRSKSNRQVGPSNSRQAEIPRQAARGGGGERGRSIHVGGLKNLPLLAIKTFFENSFGKASVSLNLSSY